MLDRYTNTGYLAEVQGIEPSTLRWQSFQDSLSTLLAYLRILYRRSIAITETYYTTFFFDAFDHISK